MGALSEAREVRSRVLLCRRRRGLVTVNAGGDGVESSRLVEQKDVEIEDSPEPVENGMEAEEDDAGKPAGRVSILDRVLRLLLPSAFMRKNWKLEAENVQKSFDEAFESFYSSTPYGGNVNIALENMSQFLNQTVESSKLSVDQFLKSQMELAKKNQEYIQSKYHPSEYPHGGAQNGAQSHPQVSRTYTISILEKGFMLFSCLHFARFPTCISSSSPSSTMGF